MGDPDQAVYHHLRTLQGHMKMTPEEALQYEGLRKTARKYRKLRRQAAHELLSNDSSRISLYGLAVYLEYLHITGK